MLKNQREMKETVEIRKYILEKWEVPLEKKKEIQVGAIESKGWIKGDLRSLETAPGKLSKKGKEPQSHRSLVGKPAKNH